MKYLITLLTLIMSVTAYGQTVRSYMQNETVSQTAYGYGPIGNVPQNAGTWVQWDASGNAIMMMDGTCWSRVGSMDGLIHYRYAGTNCAPMPLCQYQEAVFNGDFSQMRVIYSFGPSGMGVPMMGIYTYIGGGTQPAIDWINRNY